MAMQRFFEFFRRKNYGALWNNLFNFFHLRSSAIRVKFSQTYKKNNFFIWGRLFSSSSLSERDVFPLSNGTCSIGESSPICDTLNLIHNLAKTLILAKKLV